MFLISPPKETEWHAEREDLIELLRVGWPDIEVGGPLPGSSTRDVTWRITSDGETLEGSQNVQGQCQYVDGSFDLVLRYAAWWRAHVPPGQDLILYHDSYTQVIPLNPGMSVEDVRRAMAAA